MHTTTILNTVIGNKRYCIWIMLQQCRANNNDLQISSSMGHLSHKKYTLAEWDLFESPQIRFKVLRCAIQQYIQCHKSKDPIVLLHINYLKRNTKIQASSQYLDNQNSTTLHLSAYSIDEKHLLISSLSDWLLFRIWPKWNQLSTYSISLCRIEKNWYVSLLMTWHAVKKHTLNSFVCLY
jgi:hypothetical protein